MRRQNDFPGSDHPFTMAFGGTINSPGYVNALVNMANALAPVGGRLFIFGPVTPAAARQAGLERPNTVMRGLVKSRKLITQLRDEADALFVPMSFDPAEAANMQMGFPSKLTDYTAIGLPLLIYGPDYCSAVRWARENAGVAEIVTSERSEDTSAAVRRLLKNDHRRLLAFRALEVGNRFFKHEVTERVLFAALEKRHAQKICADLRA